MLQGRTGTAVISAFICFLSLLFRAEIDMQIGSGRINYTSGYVAKDHNPVDVGFGEYCQKNASSPWLCTYRLLCKSTPGISDFFRAAYFLNPRPSYGLRDLLWPLMASYCYTWPWASFVFRHSFEYNITRLTEHGRRNMEDIVSREQDSTSSVLTRWTEHGRSRFQRPGFCVFGVPS